MERVLAFFFFCSLFTRTYAAGVVENGHHIVSWEDECKTICSALLAISLLLPSRRYPGDLFFTYLGTGRSVDRHTLGAERSLYVAVWDSFCGTGLIEGANIIITANRFEWRGIVRAHDSCTLITKEPFNYEEYKDCFSGPLYVLHDPSLDTAKRVYDLRAIAKRSKTGSMDLA